MGERDAGGGKPRILVVDDSKLVRFAAEKILGRDYDVVLAEDGELGWRRVQEDPAIQVVFSDLSMPNLDGFGLLKRIRTAKDEHIHELPVIIVTSGEEEDLKETVLEQGATDFIAKPFNSVELRARAKTHASARQVTTTMRKTSAADPVTGARNRTYFIERLGKERSLARRHGHTLGVVYLELLDFKDLFIKNGKDTAYHILKQVADMLREQIREEDTLARLGLSQFALLLPMTDATGTGKLAERIRARIEQTHYPLRSQAIPVSPAVAAMQVDNANDADAETLIQQLETTAGDSGSKAQARQR